MLRPKSIQGTVEAAVKKFLEQKWKWMDALNIAATELVDKGIIHAWIENNTAN